MAVWDEPEQGKAARNLLHELVELLRRLLEYDEPSHIDLGAMELDEADYQVLRETLGEGDILAQVTNYGRVSVMESGYGGIWWVTHMDAEGQVLSDFLEVSYCPEVLIAEQEEVQDGRDALKAHLFEMGMGKKHG
jgi:hypothetical protein